MLHIATPIFRPELLQKVYNSIRNWAKNIDLVERAKNIMNELGMEVMPPADFRMRGFVNKVSV
jgi:hypothetical protein